MITIDNQTLSIILAIVILLVFNKQVLRLCLGLFVSVSSIILAVVSVVLCALVVFFVAAPTTVLTCYLLDKVSDGRKTTNSTVVQDFCGIKPTRSNRAQVSNKY